MRRLTLFTLLAASVGLLAMPDNADARRWRRCRWQHHNHCCNSNYGYSSSYSQQACPCPSQQMTAYGGGYYESQPGYVASQQQYDPQPDSVPPSPDIVTSRSGQFTSSEPRPAQNIVEVGAHDGRGFEPKVISIEPGTTVRWTNHGEHNHTVTARNDMFDEELSPGETFSFTFERAGTVEYFCRPHEDMGMVGTIEVRNASRPDSGAAPASSVQPSGAY